MGCLSFKKAQCQLTTFLFRKLGEQMIFKQVKVGFLVSDTLNFQKPQTKLKKATQFSKIKKYVQCSKSKQISITQNIVKKSTLRYIQIQKNVLCKRIIACGYMKCKLIQSNYYWFTPDMCAYIESQKRLVIFFRCEHIFPQF